MAVTVLTEPPCIDARVPMYITLYEMELCQTSSIQSRIIILMYTHTACALHVIYGCLDRPGH